MFSEFTGQTTPLWYFFIKGLNIELLVNFTMEMCSHHTFAADAAMIKGTLLRKKIETRS